MDDVKGRIDELVELMEEFKLSRAEIGGEGWRVAFGRPTEKTGQDPALAELAQHAASETALTPNGRPGQPAPKGTPVTSPMTGIYYMAPSPSAPPFVCEGDTVAAGQVVGLIEAMKVFNEITAQVSGTVTAIVAATGQVVNPGDVLLYIG